ncbi:MAG: glycosyltransferase [Bacteroidetes bacterium]|nr:glycosyltransferase [Bacteroidota bacterium]
MLPKSNNWSRRLGLDSNFLILYSGTLGLKHNPMLIAEAAKKFAEDEKILFLVISEGIGAEILKRQINDMRLTNLMVLPYQDYKDLSMVLGSADILLSILEEDAALFSVPSKVLTYLCAKKPIVLSVTETNLSAKIVSRSNAGFCATPNNINSLVDKINILITDEELRKSMGENGRGYAERNFNVAHITEKFINIFREIIAK